jgi:hypothetical protein
VAAKTSLLCQADIEEAVDDAQAFARESWNAGISLAEVAKSLPRDVRAGLREALLQPVIAGVDQVCVPMISFISKG